MEKIKIDTFACENGKIPFLIWLRSLDDKIQSRIAARLNRVEEGNFGDHKSLKDGIWELRFDFGSGYRIYYGKEKNKIVILLSGGNKSSQNKDIEKAKEYWSQYLNK